MTIIEAVNSGRAFRRSGEENYYIVTGEAIYDRRSGHRQVIELWDVRADDWELEKTVTITREQLEKAMIASTVCVFTLNIVSGDRLIINLGLGD